MADFTQELAQIDRISGNGDGTVHRTSTLQDLVAQTWADGNSLPKQDFGSTKTLPTIELSDSVKPSEQTNVRDQVTMNHMLEPQADLAEEVIRSYRRHSDRLTPAERAAERKERNAAEAMSDALMSGNIEDFKKALKDARASLTPEQLEHVVDNINKAAERLGLNLKLSLQDNGDKHGNLHVFNPYGDNEDAILFTPDGKTDIVQVVTRKDGEKFFQPIEKDGETRTEKAREFDEIAARAKGKWHGSGSGSTADGRDPYWDKPSTPNPFHIPGSPKNNRPGVREPLYPTELPVSPYRPSSGESPLRPYMPSSIDEPLSPYRPSIEEPVRPSWGAPVKPADDDIAKWIEQWLKKNEPNINIVPETQGNPKIYEY